MKRLLPMLIVLAWPVAAWAQVTAGEQQSLKNWHSATQKAGLATMFVTVGLGFPLAANKETAFSEGLCKAGDPMFGEFGCNGGLTVLHFAFALSTLGLFIATEVIAMEMSPSPYETGDQTRDNASKAFLWTNVALFSLQPVLGLLAAHPGLIGIPAEHRVAVSRVLRTIHFAVGLGLASTYSVQAGLQW